MNVEHGSHFGNFFKAMLFLPLIVGLSSFAQVASINVGSNPAVLGSVPFVNLSDAERARRNEPMPEEQARASRYDLKGAPPLFNPNDPTKSGAVHSHTRYDYNQTFDPLHVDDASVIVVGTIVSMTPHLSNNQASVYSTFLFKPTKVLKGSLPNSNIELERQGGVVLFPSGEKRYVGVMNFGLPLPNHTYMLSLSAPTPDRGSFTILGGYALSGNVVQSLDREGHKYDNLTKADFLAMVQDRLKDRLAFKN